METLHAYAPAYAAIWTVASTDPDLPEVLAKLVVYVVFFHGLARLGPRLATRPGWGFVKSRPVIIEVAVHNLLVGGMALLCFTGAVPIEWHSQWAIPAMLAHMVYELCTYCWTARDLGVAVHHAAVVATHFPGMCTVAGMRSAGAGLDDPLWLTRMSAVVALTELANLQLNYRWYLIQTLEEDCLLFRVHSLLLLIGWVISRYVMCGWVVLQAWIRLPEMEQSGIGWLIIAGTTVIIVRQTSHSPVCLSAIPPLYPSARPSVRPSVPCIPPSAPPSVRPSRHPSVPPSLSPALALSLPCASLHGHGHRYHRPCRRKCPLALVGMLS